MKKKPRNKKPMMSHGSDEWSTPMWLFDTLNKEFNFSFDLAASKDNTLCKKFFSKEDSALDRPWPKNKGVLFCNPPYSMLREFLEKAATEWKLRGIRSIFVVPARVETRAFSDSAHEIAEIRFFKGRVGFSGKANAPFPSVVLYYGGRPNTRCWYRQPLKAKKI